MDLIYKSTAAQMLGIPVKKFDLLQIEPIKIIKNPHYRRMNSYLYDKAIIEKLIDSPEVKKLIPKKREKKDWNKIFDAKYNSPRNENALTDVCIALFNLNRYAKHKSCTRRNKEEIYNLKNEVIRILYQSGYCVSTYKHILEFESKECRTCNGTGMKRGVFCYDCEGSGEITFDPSEFIVFVFGINNEKYVWHQPEEYIRFSFELTGNEEKINKTEEKPIDIPKRKLSDFKALLKWFVG